MFRSLARAARTVLAVAGMAFCGTCSDLSRFIKSFGYMEIRPPSTLLTPGTVVVVRGHHPFEGKIVCSAEESLGPSLSLIRSPTARSSSLRRRSFGLNFEASILDQVKGDARFDSLADVTLSFDKPEILTLKDSDIERLARQRTPDCRRAIARRLEDGYRVTMISSVIMGDMVIKAEWKKDDKISAAAKTTALQHLALEFGQEASNVSQDRVSAKGLIWGITDDAFLADLTFDWDALSEEARAARAGQDLAPGAKAIWAETAAISPRPKGKIAIVEHRRGGRPMTHRVPRRQVTQPEHGIAQADILESATDLGAALGLSDTEPEDFAFEAPQAIAPPLSLPLPPLSPRRPAALATIEAHIPPASLAPVPPPLSAPQEPAAPDVDPPRPPSPLGHFVHSLGPMLPRMPDGTPFRPDPLPPD